jgi:hypothetical protein
MYLPVRHDEILITKNIAVSKVMNECFCISLAGGTYIYSDPTIYQYIAGDYP